MKNKKFWLGILAMMLVFTMTCVGCKNDPADETDPSLNGRWTDGVELVLILNDGIFELSSLDDDEPLMKGTYTTEDNKISIKPSHVHGGAFAPSSPDSPSDEFASYKGYGLEFIWYSRNEFKTAVKNLDDFSDEDIEVLFSEATSSYSASTFTTTLFGEKITFTKSK